MTTTTQKDIPICLALSIVPAAVFILAIFAIWLVVVHPADPDYTYLMNGLRLSVFRAPAYADHPGTTLILIVAVVVDLIWLVRLPFGGLSPIQMDVLSSPELYLCTINLVLAGAVSVALGYFGWKVRAVTGSLLCAFAGQASFLLSCVAIQELPRVTPEPLILIVTLVLAGVLVPTVFDKGPVRADTRQAMVVGGLIAIAMVSKVTAAPLLILLLLLRDRRLIVIGVLSCVAGAILLTLPIAGRYLQMFQWFFGLATHVGHYGSGESGVPDAATFARNLAGILYGAPELVGCLAICLALALLLWRAKFEGASRLARALLIIASVLGVQFAMVAKHFGLRYLLPMVSIACLVSVIFVYSAARLDRARYAAMAALFAIVAFGFFRSGTETYSWLDNKRIFHAKKIALLKRVAAAGCVLIPYNESLPEFSVNFGNRWANFAFSKYAAEIHPNYLEYDFGSRGFRTSEMRLDAVALDARLLSEKCVYLIGAPIRPQDNFPVSAERLQIIEQIHDVAGNALAVYAWRRDADGSFLSPDMR